MSYKSYMSYMNYIVKGIILLYFMAELVAGGGVTYGLLSVFLIIVAIQIYNERFAGRVGWAVATLLLVYAGAAADTRFAVLFALTLYDFTLKKSYVGLAAAFGGTVYFAMADTTQLPSAAWGGLCILLAAMQRTRQQEREHFRQTLDNERRLRYELEQAKAQLLHSSKEIASIAEVKERNRIARDIHDSIGHSIAGILIQLQAAYKLHAKDEAKSLALVSKSIEGLAGSVEMLRETVHNIKPRERTGVEYVRSIVDNFAFCPVELKLSGDFNDVPAAHLEIVATNMKEALTNAARYSQATKVDITVDANERYTRLYIKDNGVGCPRIKEGLGLSGMKERVRNMGGTVSISAGDGFLIVCVIPREGSGLLEGAYR